MANFENKQNASVPTELRSEKSRVESTSQSTLQRNYDKYKPEQYDSDEDQLEDQLEEVAIDEKFKHTALEDGSYYIPCCSKIEERDEKKGGLLLLMNAESAGFINVIVSYKYVRQFRKLLKFRKPYQIFVYVVEAEFTATNGYNAGNIVTYNKLEFCATKNGALNRLTKTLPSKKFVDKFDEDTAAEIAEKVYNNKDEKAEEYFCMWSAELDEKEREIEERKNK